MLHVKLKANTIFNHNLPLLGTLIFCWAFYLGYIVDGWYYLFFIISLFLIIKNKPNWKQIIIVVSLVIIYVCLTIFVPDFSLISLINKRPQIVRKSMINFFEKNYDEETYSFIELILLNIKSNKSWFFYKQIVDLGVVWLFCISGFHISLISWLIKLLFKKRPKIGKYFNLFVIGFCSYILNFSYASLRIFFKIILNPLLVKLKINQYNKVSFIGLLISIFNPVSFINYGFILTMLISYVRTYVWSLNLNNKLIASLLISIGAFAVIIPFVFELNHKISLLTFINSFVFSYISIFVFFYFLLFSWMPFMAIVHRGIIVAVYGLIGNISFNNIFIYSPVWPSWLFVLYFSGIYILFKILYLIVYDNKI